MSKLYLTAAEADEAARRAIRWLCTSVQQQDVVETESEGAVREIKFRAYQPEAKGDLKWWSWQELRESDLNTIFRYPEKYHLMQYTGLKDKNGVEIYEGDIVLSKSWQKHLVEYNVDFLGFATRILDTSHKGQTFPLTSQITYNDKHGIQSMHVEVVGNKWDNPELLEATP